MFLNILFFSELLSQKDIPLIVRRYIYETKISINYAKENNLTKLHLGVGCTHEPPLEYFLKLEFI